MILVGMAAVGLLGWATTWLLGLVERRALRLERGGAGPEPMDRRPACLCARADRLGRARRSACSSASGPSLSASGSCRASSCRRRSRSLSRFVATAHGSRSPARRCRGTSPRASCATRSASLLAAAVGVPLGLLMGWFRWLDDIVTPLFDALRFIAPIAWVPFAALWFGTGIGGPILIIFAGAFPPCLINAYRGARFVEPRLIEAAPHARHRQSADRSLEVLLPASTAVDRGGPAGRRPASAGNRSSAPS